MAAQSVKLYKKNSDNNNPVTKPWVIDLKGMTCGCLNTKQLMNKYFKEMSNNSNHYLGIINCTCSVTCNDPQITWKYSINQKTIFLFKLYTASKKALVL